MLLSTLAVAVRVIRQISRDRRSLVMIFISPIVFMLVFGYSFSGEIYGVKIGIVNLDRGFKDYVISREIIDGLDGDTYRLVSYTSLDEALEDLDNLEIRGVIFFNESFTMEVLSGDTDFIIYLDGGDPVIADRIYGDILQVIKDVSAQYGFIPPYNVVRSYVYGGEDLRFIDAYIPGMICAAASILSLVLTLISFVRERTRGTLYRMLVTPVSRWSIILGYTLAFAIIIIIQSLILLAVALYLFQVKIYGDLYLMMGIVILAGIGYQSTGVALSLYAKNEFQAFQFMPLIFTPSIFLSGIFAPIEALPEYIRPITRFIPLTYAVEAVKNVAIRGWGLPQILSQIIILMFFAFTMLLLARFALRR